MFAVAFDLRVAELNATHPRGPSQAYTDVFELMGKHGFRRAQHSVYLSDSEDMSQLFQAIQALHSLTWFRSSVRDIRAFRAEQWSDFTPQFKAQQLSGERL